MGATTLLGLAVVACADSSAATDLAALPVMSAPVAGTTNSFVETNPDGKVFRQMDVTGEWNAVSASIADVVQAHGWTIESINCVGTGNDVISRKQVDGRWILMEAGAGETIAGMILSVPTDQRPARTPLEVTGRCPQVLVAAASS